ncbi:hypothetical protein HD593_011707 [Nonomuraea rubra]|uniref:Uncharacterized protein n=1 Tax=Nonomuraea rubra TaxID=46180 RepID=A0A7X0P8B4_9ACTN|nr:hypothetical protein [Nonomuraea rubra]
MHLCPHAVVPASAGRRPALSPRAYRRSHALLVHCRSRRWHALLGRRVARLACFLRRGLLHRARCAPRTPTALRALRSACLARIRLPRSLPHRAARFSLALLLALLASLIVALRLLRPPASPCSSRRPPQCAHPCRASSLRLSRSFLSAARLRHPPTRPRSSPATALCLPLRPPRSASSLVAVARRPSAILRLARPRPLHVPHHTRVALASLAHGVRLAAPNCLLVLRSPRLVPLTSLASGPRRHVPLASLVLGWHRVVRGCCGWDWRILGLSHELGRFVTVSV